MPIIIKNRGQNAEKVIENIIKHLEQLQQDVVDSVKVYLEKVLPELVSIEPLYELKDFIDDLIVNWQDEEIELEEDDL